MRVNRINCDTGVGVRPPPISGLASKNYYFSIKKIPFENHDMSFEEWKTVHVGVRSVTTADPPLLRWRQPRLRKSRSEANRGPEDNFSFKEWDELEPQPIAISRYIDMDDCKKPFERRAHSCRFHPSIFNHIPRVKKGWRVLRKKSVIPAPSI